MIKAQGNTTVQIKIIWQSFMYRDSLTSLKKIGVAPIESIPT